MATKKAAPQKAVKPAPPVKKPVSKSAPKASAKPAPLKNTKPASKKAMPQKAVVSKTTAAPKKTVAPAKAMAKGGAKKTVAAAPQKSGPSKPAVAKSTAKLPVKPAPAKAVAKSAPPKNVEPVKKTAVQAKTHNEVKPAIKPLSQPAAKKEPAKPAKPFVVPKTSTTKSVKYDPDFTKSVLDANKQQPEENKPSQRYSDAELTEFRELINRKLETAKKELAYLQGLITRKDESGDLDEGRYMTMEDGSMSMEREQLSQMASRQIQFIDHLEKAIMRIENKTYGICRVTGKLIDKARLRAVPHATLSIEAKQLMNK